MKVLIDTSIWSHALRSNNDAYRSEINCLVSLISDQRAIIIGPIRQEILSGYSDSRKFEIFREKLSCFENATILDVDYGKAAEFRNICRKNGIQGSHIEFLICAVSIRLDIPIYTNDQDFSYFKKAITIKTFNTEN